MPDRSVRTLKLIARSAFTTAKRTAFASSQPPTSTSTASASRGRKTRHLEAARAQRLEKHVDASP